MQLPRWNCAQVSTAIFWLLTSILASTRNLNQQSKKKDWSYSQRPTSLPSYSDHSTASWCCNPNFSRRISEVLTSARCFAHHWKCVRTLRKYIWTSATREYDGKYLLEGICRVGDVFSSGLILSCSNAHCEVIRGTFYRYSPRNSVHFSPALLSETSTSWTSLIIIIWHGKYRFTVLQCIGQKKKKSHSWIITEEPAEMNLPALGMLRFPNITGLNWLLFFEMRPVEVRSVTSFLTLPRRVVRSAEPSFKKKRPLVSEVPFPTSN